MRQAIRPINNDIPSAEETPIARAAWFTIREFAELVGISYEDATLARIHCFIPVGDLSPGMTPRWYVHEGAPGYYRRGYHRREYANAPERVRGAVDRIATELERIRVENRLRADYRLRKDAAPFSRRTARTGTLRREAEELCKVSREL